MWLALLALTFNGLNHSGLVLCIAGAGHLAIEVACDGTPDKVVCCSTEHNEHSDTALTEDSHCGDCSDLLLRSHPPMIRKSMIRKSMMPVNSASIPVLLPSLADLTRPFSDALVLLLPRSVPSPSTGGHLHTIVLRL